MQSSPAEFIIDETFSVPGVGTVVAGTVKKGVIYPNMTLMMGEWAGGQAVGGLVGAIMQLQPQPAIGLTYSNRCGFAGGRFSCLLPIFSVFGL